MSNPNKAKGTAWESAVRDHLNDFLGLYVDHWRELPPGVTKFVLPFSPLNVKRQAQEGNHDVGDLHAWPFIIECKDVKSSAVPAWIRQGLVEAKNAGFHFAVVAHKTRGKGTAAGRVFLDVRTFTRLRLIYGAGAREFCDVFGFELSARGLDTGRWYFATTVNQLGWLIRYIRASGHNFYAD